MGFGTVAANMLFFIAVLTMSAGLIMYMNNFAAETTARLTEQKNRMSEELQTNIIITSAEYDSQTNTTTVYARNNGRTLIIKNQVDIYLSKQRIPSTQFTIAVEEDTDVGNTDIWDPGETMKIIIPDMELGTGIHTVRVLAFNGVGAEEIVTT